MNAPQLTETELNEIYNWIDEIPLSRPKKNITRDFSDGVLMAEVLAHYVPKLVEIHNYSAANSVQQKLYNWNTLNQKVCQRMGFQISKQDIQSVVNCQPDCIERLLKVFQVKIEQYLQKKDLKSQNQGQTSQEHSYQNYSQAHNQNNNNNNNNFNMGNNSKDETILELRETVEILELKIKKLEQLVQLKDNKIQTLANKLSKIDG